MPSPTRLTFLSVFTILSCCLSLALAQSTYYVNQNIPSDSPDGSIQNPFNDLSQAFEILQSGTFELLLLGDNITVSSFVQIPADSDYTIKPSSIPAGQTHYPLYLQDNSCIQVYGTKLTIEDIQFIEQNYERSNSEMAIDLADGSLTLNRILIRDLEYYNNYYLFLNTASNGVETELTINYGEFYSLANIEISLTSTKFNLLNSVFSNLTETLTPVFIVLFSAGTEYGVICQNNTIQDSTFIYNVDGSGFLYLLLSNVDVLFDGLFVKDVTIQTGTAVFYTFMDTSVSLGASTTLTIANSTFQNIVEAENLEPLALSVSGLVFHMLGDMNLIMSNLSLDNINLYESPFIKSDASVANEFLGIATLSTINVTNCLRTQIYILALEATAERMILENNTYNSTDNSVAIFYFFQTPTVMARDFRGTNNTGTILYLLQVYNQTIQDFVFYDSKTSQEFAIDKQYLIHAERTSQANFYAQWGDSEKVAIYQNLQFYGYTDVNGIDASKTSNDSYAIYLVSEFGKNYLRDSVFIDVEMGVLALAYINHIEIDNITMDADPSTPANEIAKHRPFQLVEVQECSILNSRFFNHQNVIWLSFIYLRRNSVYPEFPLGSLTLDNITVKNSIVVTDPSESIYTSLCYINSPQQPIKLTIKNSHFANNTIGAGIINTEQCAKVDVDLLNNTFEDNYSLKQGSILVAQSMQQQTSDLNFINNTFLNNSCFLNGGLFYFVHTNHKITSINNGYTLSVAKNGGGGVGYLYRSKVDYTETNGTYLTTSSNGPGGCWYANILRNDTKDPLIKFIDTKFYDSSTSKRGGAIFVQTGDVSFFNCIFKNTQAQEGGIAHVDSWGSMIFNTVVSTQNYAAQGSLLSTGAVFQETFIIKDSSFKDIATNQISSNMIVMNYGLLIIDTCSFQNVHSSLFKLTSVTINIANTKINQIYCINQAAACIINAKDSNVSLRGSSIVEVTTNRDLISMEGSLNSLIAGSSEISNFKKSTTASSGELFGFNLLQLASANFQDLNFTSFDISVIKAKQTTLTVSGLKFLSATTARILQENTLLSSKQSQFILLDSSSSMIANTTFTGGSSSSVNGGAIRLMGEGGNHVISNSVFEKNQGLNGGAISAQGKINNLQIENSQFRNNSASNDGAGIFIDNGVTGNIIISGSTFETNKAQNIGTLFSGNNQLRVQNSTFNANTATSGGAVAYMGLDDSKLSLTGNTFNRNNAKLGAAILTMGNLDFTNQDNNFTNNTATYGGDLGSKPTSVMLRIYEVQEAFLYIDTASTEYMLAHPATKLIYNSQDPSLQQKLYMKTGRSPNYIFEFAILDQLGHLLPIFQAINLQIGIRTKSSTSLLGTTEYNFIQGAQGISSGFVFNRFYVRGQIGLTTVITAQLQAFVPIFEETYNLPAISWTVEIAPCSIGEVYDETNIMCNPCARRTFSTENPFAETTACRDCFPSATCLGGNIVFPEPGYWRMDASSDNIVACANPASCLGGQIDEGRNISLTGFCAEPYSGPGCGVCAQGYVRFGSDAECLSCSKNGWDHVRFVAFFLIQAILAAFGIKSYIASEGLDPKERKFNMLKASLMKIIVDFLHVCSLTLAFNLDWPNQVKEFLRISSETTPTNKDVFTIDCIIAIARGTNEAIFLIKSLIIIIQPLVYIIVALLIWAIIFKVKKRKIRGNSDFTAKIILTTIIIVYILQPDIIKTTFQLFDCDNFGSTTNTKYYLMQDPSVECWTSTHVAWLLGIAIPSLIIWLIAPSLILLSLIKRKDLTRSEEFRKRYNFIFEKYTPAKFYWDVPILLRKVILIILTVFLTFTYLQAYFGFAILVLAFIFQFFKRPYIDPYLNITEMISLVSSAFIMYTGLFFVRDFQMTNVVGLLLVLDIIAAVIFFCYCVYVFKDLAIQKLRLIKEKLDPIIGAETFKWVRIRNLYRKIMSYLLGPDPSLPELTARLSLKDIEMPEPSLDDVDLPNLSSKEIEEARHSLKNTEMPKKTFKEVDISPTKKILSNSYAESPTETPGHIMNKRFGDEQVFANHQDMQQPDQRETEQALSNNFV